MLMMWKHSFADAGASQPLSPQAYLTTFIDVFLNGLLSSPK